MEKKGESSIPSHEEWRRIAKRERRRRVRRKAAQERDCDEERLRATLESTAEYSKWISEQENERREREMIQQREHDEREKLWLEDEVRAQKEWRVNEDRRAKVRGEQLLQEEMIRKDFEAKQEALRMKREEAKRERDEETRKREDLEKEIDDYIDNGSDTPGILRAVSETQSGKDPCPFFTKTGACRYGDICSRNHLRLALSKVILIPGFYSHFSLEKNSAEYDTDISLEFESSETRQHFEEFYESVLPELESFGRIKTLKCCKNSEIHLRGNLYVEYYTEREAARALRKLKGRYYAQRQLNCEFVNLTSWRNAVCGMTKCPKGRACNFLHTFRNPNDEYDIKSPPRWASGCNKSRNEQTVESCCSGRNERSSRCKSNKWDDWDRGSRTEQGTARCGNWSESPENRNERSSDRRHNSQSDRKRSKNGEQRSSPSPTSPTSPTSPSWRHDSEKRSNSWRGSGRRNDSSEENSSRKRREIKSRKRHKSDEKITEREIRKSKKIKSAPIRRLERTFFKEKSRHASRTGREEYDENVDTNSNNSRTSNQTETVSSDGLIEENFPTPAAPVIKRTYSASANDWDTTDSE